MSAWEHKIEEEVIVITRASSGMGEATARLLAARGAKIVLRARRIDRLGKIVRLARIGPTTRMALA